MSNTLSGNLLVATPLMDDNTLHRTVCLVVHHDAANVIGVVLNRPIQGEVTSLDGDHAISQWMTKQGLHFGGPNASPIMALHRSNISGSAGQLCLASDKDTVHQVLNRQEENVRLIVGHLKWSIEEFTKQLAKGFWGVLPASSASVFDASETMWDNAMRKINSAQLAAWVGAKHIPLEPSMN